MLSIKYTRITIRAVKTSNRSRYRYIYIIVNVHQTGEQAPGEVQAQVTNHRRPERMQDTRKRAAVLLL